MPKLPPKKLPEPPDHDEDDDDFEDEEDEREVEKITNDDPLPGEDSRATRIRVLSEAGDEELDLIKKWSCSFYQATNPMCVGCRQSEDKVIDCRDTYLEKIQHFPSLDTWGPIFDRPVVRQRTKVALKEIAALDMTCNACYMANKCPSFEKNASCAIDFGTPADQLTDDLILDGLIELQKERVTRQAMFEKTDGGVADGNLSAEMDRLADLVAIRANRNQPSFKFSVEGSGETGVKQGGGLLASIFGKALGGAAAADKPLEIGAGAAEFIEPEFVEDEKTKPVKLKTKKSAE